MRKKINAFLYKLYLKKSLSIGQLEEIEETEEMLGSKELTIPLLLELLGGIV